MLFVRPTSLLHFAAYPDPAYLARRDHCAAKVQKSDDKESSEEERQYEKNLTVYQRRNADIVEKDNAFVLTIDLPGVKESDISIEAKKQFLTVTASRTGQDNVTYKYRQDFVFDKKSVNIAELDATLADGVLTLTLPKKAVEEAQAITVLDQEAPEFADDEKKKHVAVSFDVPGVKLADLSVSFHDDGLSVKGLRRKGQSTTEIARRIRLDADSIERSAFKAYLSSGVLTVVVPRNETKTHETKYSFKVSEAIKTIELNSGGSKDDGDNALAEEDGVVVETVGDATDA
jgi:HSP20 family molecular chaperone IbpA